MIRLTNPLDMTIAVDWQVKQQTKQTNKAFSINSFRNTIRVSNSLDPDQARQNIGRDLGPNCLQKFSQTTLVGRVITGRT